MKKTIAVILCVILCFSASFAAFADSSIGENLSWKIDGNTLTISGKGAMTDFNETSDAPWSDSKNVIENIVIEDGVTRIGNFAFYGLKNLKTVSVPNSVESIGLEAFSYTEGSVESLNNVNAPYQFTVSCDNTYAEKGTEFYINIDLKGDFKDVSLVQGVLVFDDTRVSANADDWCDAQWLKTIDSSNLGYISDPLNGIVTNTARIGYFSTSGKKIDEESPLYNAGETTVTVARFKFTALTDISDLNTSCFYLKDNKVAISDDSLILPECGAKQLSTSTMLPIKDLTILTDNKTAVQYAESKGIAVLNPDGTKNDVTADVQPEVPSESYVNTQTADEISVLIDGAKVEFDVKPMLINDRTLVPMRAVFEGLNAKVIWDDETQTAFAMKDSMITAIQIDNKTMSKSDVFSGSQNIELDVPAMLINDRTLVPIRAVSEAFGCNVDWNDETQTVIITTK